MALMVAASQAVSARWAKGRAVTMRFLAGMVGAAALAVVGHPSIAQDTAVDLFIDGNDLYRICQAARLTSCAAYIVGVADTLAIFEGVETPPCFESAQIRQLADTVVIWLGANPSQRHLPAASIVNIALREAFPCGA